MRTRASCGRTCDENFVLVIYLPPQVRSDSTAVRRSGVPSGPQDIPVPLSTLSLLLLYFFHRTSAMYERTCDENFVPVLYLHLCCRGPVLNLGSSLIRQISGHSGSRFTAVRSRFELFFFVPTAQILQNSWSERRQHINFPSGKN
jgi:hypothetical protein